MSYFILDGYNIINSLPQLKAGTLRDSRTKLLRLLEVYHFRKHQANLAIVFDGQDNIPDHPQESDFKVMFSKGESADDLIEKLARSYKNPKSIIVVTNDQGLAKRIKSLGGSCWGVEKFFIKLLPARNSREVKDKFDLGSAEIKSINEELRKIWLGE